MHKQYFTTMGGATYAYVSRTKLRLRFELTNSMFPLGAAFNSDSDRRCEVLVVFPMRRLYHTLVCAPFNSTP